MSGHESHASSITDEQAATMRRILRAQDIRRVLFILFIVLFVYAQSYAGRVYLREDLLASCKRAQRAYHVLHMTASYADCNRTFPEPSPWPWR